MFFGSDKPHQRREDLSACDIAERCAIIQSTGSDAERIRRRVGKQPALAGVVITAVASVAPFAPSRLWANC